MTWLLGGGLVALAAVIVVLALKVSSLAERVGDRADEAAAAKVLAGDLEQKGKDAAAQRDELLERLKASEDVRHQTVVQLQGEIRVLREDNARLRKVAATHASSDPVAAGELWDSVHLSPPDGAEGGPRADAAGSGAAVPGGSTPAGGTPGGTHA